MQAPLAAYRELAVNYDTFPKLLYVLDIKHNKFYSMPHIPVLWYIDTSLAYPNDFVESNLL